MTHRTIDFATHKSDDFHEMWHDWCLEIAELDSRVENSAVLAREAVDYIDQIRNALVAFVEGRPRR